MNKYLITAALASALALTACGKKEEAASETAAEEVKPADEAKPAEGNAEKSTEKMGEWGDTKKDEAATTEAPKAEEPKAEEKKEEEKKADAGTPEEARQLAENTISQTPETETKQQ